MLNSITHSSTNAFTLNIEDLGTSINKIVTDNQRVASRRTNEVVKRSIESGYRLGTNESGTGCIARIRSHMDSCITMRTQSGMYSECLREINRELDGLLKKIEDGIAKRVDATLTSFFQNLNMFWVRKMNFLLN